jgi:light-regulated signal transduction histidine kinase (bacteriophytochrome)
MSPEPLLSYEKELKAFRRLSEAVAHDVNNQLSGILGYTELLKSEPAIDSLKPQIEEISAAGRRIASLIRIMLALGDKYVSRAETLDINRLLLEIEKLISRILGAEIQFTTIKAPELLPILADPARMKLALIALANEMKYLISNNGQVIFATGSVPDERENSKGMGLESFRMVVVTATSLGNLSTQHVQELQHRLASATDEKNEERFSGASEVDSLAGWIGGSLLPESISEREFRIRLQLPAAHSGIGT